MPYHSIMELRIRTLEGSSNFHGLKPNPSLRTSIGSSAKRNPTLPPSETKAKDSSKELILKIEKKNLKSCRDKKETKEVEELRNSNKKKVMSEKAPRGQYGPIKSLHITKARPIGGALSEKINVRDDKRQNLTKIG